LALLPKQLTQKKREGRQLLSLFGQTDEPKTQIVTEVVGESSSKVVTIQTSEPALWTVPEVRSEPKKLIVTNPTSEPNVEEVA